MLGRKIDYQGNWRGARRYNFEEEYRLKKARRRRRVGIPMIGFVWAACAMAGAAMIGWGAAPTSSAVLPVFSSSMPICGGGKRISCVVDGDTIWFQGEKIRLQGFNAPEINGSCARETSLARQARDRLRSLLISGTFSIERNGHDRYGRTLATVRVGGRDVTDVMVGEGLAHVWRGHKESWCD